jgi:NADH-quinone oxidoreductase subunit F
MDIRRVESDPTDDERAAVDALLGPPSSAWDGGPRGSQRDAHVSHVGGRDTRALRDRLLPALQALQARVGWRLSMRCSQHHRAPGGSYTSATTSPASALERMQ